MSSEGANAAGGGPDIGVRTPRQSAIRMMETMKTLAPAERRPAAPQRKSEQTASSAGAHGSPSETPQAKRKQAPPQPAAAAPEPVTVKRRRQQSSPEVGVLEWLEAEAEKRPVDNAPAAALPRGLEPPERPPAPALLFLQKIRSRIRQPPGAAWSLKQLAQGVTRLFDALPPTHQQQYRNAAKEAMDKYKAEMARIRPQGSKAVESSTDQGQRGRAPSAYKVYERNVMPRLRHANPDKQEEELIKMCKKEWASISEKEKRTYQFLAERDRERLRTQELLWREASVSENPHLCCVPHSFVPRDVLGNRCQ